MINKKTPPKAQKWERAKAHKIGLSVTQYRILFALKKAGRELCYEEIYERTGYWQNLSENLRSESRKGKIHKNSLSTKGLVTEMYFDHEEDGRRYVFAITPRGRLLLNAARD